MPKKYLATLTHTSKDGIVTSLHGDAYEEAHVFLCEDVNKELDSLRTLAIEHADTLDDLRDSQELAEMTKDRADLHKLLYEDRKDPVEWGSFLLWIMLSLFLLISTGIVSAKFEELEQAIEVSEQND